MSVSALNKQGTITSAKKEYTFAYCPADRRWGQKWMRTRQQFADVHLACDAASQWMEACYGHGWPISVRIEEVS